jgi:two-component system response regulator FixJ
MPKIGCSDQMRLVCVVDDDPAVRDSLGVMLESHGFDVLTYGSGAEFLEDARHHRAGCLIVDYHMPKMNGLDTVDALHGRGTTLPTILISGRLDGALTEQAQRLGLVAILHKPFATRRLVELVAASLNRSQRRS